MKLLARWLLSTLILLGGAYLIPGIEVDTFFTAVWVTLILGLASVTIKPLMVLLTFPVTVVTLGLFVFVINALLILGAARLINGFAVEGFWMALVLALFVAAANTLFNEKKK